MNFNIFCRCSLFPSWSGEGLTSNPVIITFLIPTIQTIPFHSTHPSFQVFSSSQRLIQNYSLLRCDTIFLGKLFMKFWRNTLLSCWSDKFFCVNKNPPGWSHCAASEWIAAHSRTWYIFNIPEDTNPHMHAL